MKATPTLQQAIVEKCLRNVWQPLPIIVFTLFFSIISTSHGGYLLAGSSRSDASGEKSECEYDYAPPVSFQEVQDIAAVQPTIEWDKTLGGDGRDIPGSILSTPDGGYLIVGSFLVKIDENGNTQWEKPISARSGIASPEGGYLLVGSFLVKIDEDGNTQWEKPITISAESGIASPDGGYLLAGNSGSDYWAVKIDAEGNKVWDKTLGGSDDDRLQSATSTPDGGYLLAGFSYSDASGDKSENSRGEYDYWIVKIDAQGNKVWDKTFGGNDVDDLHSAISTPDGGYLLGGFSWSNASGDKSENSKGLSDYWIVKIDAQGNKVWDKTIGGSSYDEIQSNSIISTNDGGYLLAGFSSSNTSGDKSENSRVLSDYWVVKIDTHGNKVWDKTIGGSNHDEPESVISTPDGGYLLAGASNSPVSGDKSEGNKGDLDYWIVKLQDHTTPIVTSLTLIDAQTDQEIQELKNGDIINLADVGSGLLNIRANLSAAQIQHVRLQLQGPVRHTQVEKQFPYTLFGDNKGDYAGRQLPAGRYTLTATPSFRNIKGIALTVSFEVVKDGVAVQPTIEWDKTFGGSSFEELPSVIPTPDGGYLLAGSSDSPASGDKSENSKGGCDQFGYCDTDYWIVKTDAQGNKVWDKTLGGNRNDYLFSVIPTPDGGYLLAGWSSSDASGDKSEDSKGENDYWIVKTDAQGNKVWDKTIGGSGPDLFSRAILTPDGGYLLSGFSSSDASGDKSEDSKGENDYWIVKTDAQGNKKWDKTLGGNGHETLFPSAILTPDGGYLLAGYSDSPASGDKSENSKGFEDYWIVKIDAEGNKIWDKTLGGNSSDFLHNATLTSDGGYLLAGESSSDASGDKSEGNNKTESNLSSIDYWAVKIDAEGNKVWDKTLGGSSRDHLYNAFSTPDGGYLLAGSSGSDASEDKSEDSKGFGDYWVIKIDANRNKIWDKTIGGSRDEGLQNAISLPDGGYLLAGYSFSDASGDKSENSRGERDYWIVKLKDHTTPIVTSLTLIDAQTDQEIQELKEGDIINLAEVGSGLLNIRANLSAAQIQHVRLQLQGPVRHTQVEKQFPYALFGDNQGDYAGRQLPAGRYTLTATPFFKNTRGIALTVSFEVTEAPEATARQVKVYPVPTSDMINILHEGVGEESHLMLLDFKGKMLLYQPLSTQPLDQLDLSGFKKGIYYLRIVSAEGVQVFRVAKE